MSKVLKTTLDFVFKTLVSYLILVMWGVVIKKYKNWKAKRNLKKDVSLA